MVNSSSIRHTIGWLIGVSHFLAVPGAFGWHGMLWLMVVLGPLTVVLWQNTRQREPPILRN